MENNGTNVQKHTIMLDPEAIPVAAKLRAIPVYRREKALEQIDLMEMQGIWSKVERSKWVHPLVAVDKADGSVRITTDLSKLNDHVIPYQFPLPHIQDVYLKLSKATTFTKLDLRMGYFNLELDENSRLLTTTITPKGLYAYNRLPMGLRDAGAVFQAKVAETLKDCPQCVSYMDDIVVYGRSRQEHDNDLSCSQGIERPEHATELTQMLFRKKEIRSFLGTSR